MRLALILGYTSAQAWLNDGSRVVFFSGDSYGYNYQIYTMNPDGTNITQLTTTNNTVHDNGCVSWSIDGQTILYRFYIDSDLEIYKMNTDGSNQTRVTDSPDWVEHMSL